MRLARVGALVVASVSVAACTATPVGAPPNSSPARTSSNVAQAGRLPAQPDGVPFPTRGWPRGDWPSGANRPVVDKAVDEAFAGGAENRVRSVAIIHHGRLVYERYSPNAADGPTVNMPSFSVAKSITCAMVGVLVRQGRISVTAPARAPEWTGTGDPRAAITLDDLLRMSSGLEWNEDTDIGAATSSRDAAKAVAEHRLVHSPGTTFNYSTGSTFIVDRAMAMALGGGARFTELIRSELFTKLGMTVTLSYDAMGTWLGGYAAYATTVDYAKFGLLYLRDGTWAGQRILPPGWVDYSRTPSRTNPRYGSGWWLDPNRPGDFFAIGYRGQVIGVDPAHDLTYAINSNDEDLSKAVSGAILTAFWSA